MTYLLTVWLLAAGQLLAAQGEISSASACRAKAESLASQNGATLVAYRCVLQQEV